MGSGRSRAQERIDNGLCPQCGEEAAPYRLCYDHRQKARILRVLNRMVKRGNVRETADGRLYNGDTKLDGRWDTPLHGDLEKDRRFAPKLGGIPVNVEAKIMELIGALGNGCTVDDVVRAWGILRGERRKKGSAARDVRAILLAEEKRRRRAERRLLTAGVTAPTP